MNGLKPKFEPFKAFRGHRSDPNYYKGYLSHFYMKEMKGGHMDTTQKSDTITIKKDALWKYSTFVLLGIVILGVIFFVLPNKSTPGNVVNQPGQLLPSEPTAKITVETDGAPIKGDKNAPVELVEFTDYECPFCARHFSQSGSAIDARIEAGDVK